MGVTPRFRFALPNTYVMNFYGANESWNSIKALRIAVPHLQSRRLLNYRDYLKNAILCRRCESILYVLRYV